MNLYSYTYKGKIYDFRMSYGAKLEIEKVQRMSMGALRDKDVIKAMSKFKKLQNNLDSLSEDELAEVLPAISKIDALETELDAVKVGYILLKNNRDHRGLTEEEFYDILNDMEEKLGFEETMEIFEDMNTKVFMLLEKLNVSRNKKQMKKSKAS